MIASAEAGKLTTDGIEARRAFLNELWARQYDADHGGSNRRITTEECGERDRLNRAHAEREKQKAAAPKPRPARSTVGANNFKALGDATADAVAREIVEMRRDVELMLAKGGEAIARLEAAIARVETRG